MIMSDQVQHSIALLKGKDP